MMTVDYNPRTFTDVTGREHSVPVLVYTRKHGWFVCTPTQRPDRPGLFGWARPGYAMVYWRDILAIEALPPPPDSAS
jgi:hypothetical protein